jgi:hypothetical protein
MNSAALASLAVAALVPLTLALLGKAFPAKGSDFAGCSLEALAPVYRKWELLFVALYMIFWAPVTYAIWVPLEALARWHTGLLPAAQMTLTVDPMFWLLPALFLSLVVSAAPLIWIAKLLLGQRYREYEKYIALKVKYDVDRVSRLLIGVVGIGSGILVFLALNWYVLVLEDAVVVNRLLGLSEDYYHYADIRQIRTAPRLTAPNGNVVSRREFVVTLIDGRTWSTNYLPMTRGKPKDQELVKRELIQVVSERSGVPIEEVKIFRWAEL